MSKYFALDPKTGTYGDIVCRKFSDHESHQGWYNVFVGERNIGQVIKDTHHGWTAISNAQGDDLRGWRSVAGFGKRWFAIEYLLRAGSIWGPIGSYVPPSGQIYLPPEEQVHARG